MAIGHRVRTLRRAAGWTQQRLARLAGLSRATIAALESGRYASCETATVQALARALHVAPSRLVDERKRPPQAPGPRAAALQRFYGSTWPAALRLTSEEIAWLDGLSPAFWDEAHSPMAVGELIAWHRRHV